VQAESGMTTGMRTADGRPQIIPFQLVDNASGHVLAQAVLAALLNRERHGVADVVKVAMYDVAVGLQSNQLTLHLNTARTTPHSPERQASSGSNTSRRGFAFATQPSDAFQTADGYVVVSAYVPKHWALLCHAIGRPELIADERFTDQRTRSINYQALRDELESALAAKTAADWVPLLQAEGIMATVPQTWKQVVTSALFAENELGIAVGAGEQAVNVVRTPARYSTFTAAALDAPPAPGQHNDLYLTAGASADPPVLSGPD